MFQSQQQRQYQYQDGKTVSEWANDCMQLRVKFNDFKTELMKFNKKYGCGNGNHDVEKGVAASPLPSKKRERWSEKEHDLFVSGLAKYGKGRWKTISQNVLPSKTPTQIASHAQKYFNRQGAEKKRKSIHDITNVNVNECVHQNQAMLPPPPPVLHSQNQNCLPPPLPLPRNCYDVAAPQDHQLQKLAVHAEKEYADEAILLPHVDLPPLPHDWDQLLDQHELQHQMNGLGACGITSQDHAMLLPPPHHVVHSQNHECLPPHLPPPQDHQLQQQAVHAEKESADEAMVFPQVDLPPLPHDWDQHLWDDQQELQQLMNVLGTCDMTTQVEEEEESYFGKFS